MLKFTPKAFTSEDIFDSFLEKDNEFFQEQQWTYTTTDSEFENFFNDKLLKQDTYDDDFFDNLFSPETCTIEQTTDISDNNASFDSIDMQYINPAMLSLTSQVFETKVQNSVNLIEKLPSIHEAILPAKATPSKSVNTSKPIKKIQQTYKPKAFSNRKCSSRTTPRKQAVHDKTPAMMKKIEKFYNLLKENNVFVKAMQLTKETMIKNQIRPVNFEVVKDFTLPALMPNNYTLKDFEKIQGKNGYHYLSNASHSSTWATPRWMKHKKNFYQPSVIRKVRNENNKLSDGEGLCPYCPIHDFENPDDCFYSMSGALYQHHLCKSHGVYTSGIEMPVPAFGIKNDTLFACCTECDATINVRLCGKTLTNCLKPYYRHCFDHHNVSKKMVKNT